VRARENVDGIDLNCAESVGSRANVRDGRSPRLRASEAEGCKREPPRLCNRQIDQLDRPRWLGDERANARYDLAPEEIDAAHHVFVRQRSSAVLHIEPRNAEEL